MYTCNFTLSVYNYCRSVHHRGVFSTMHLDTEATHWKPYPTIQQMSVCQKNGKQHVQRSSKLLSGIYQHHKSALLPSRCVSIELHVTGKWKTLKCGNWSTEMEVQKQKYIREKKSHLSPNCVCWGLVARGWLSPSDVRAGLTSYPSLVISTQISHIPSSHTHTHTTLFCNMHINATLWTWPKTPWTQSFVDRL